MSSLRVLHPHPVAKPDKLSMNLGQHQPLHQPTMMAPLKLTQRFYPPNDYPRRNSLRFAYLSSSPPSSYVPTMHRSRFSKYSFSTHKKRVVFADEVGRALTVEHVFTPDPPSPPPAPATNPCSRHLEGQQNPANRNGSLTPKFGLGFPQPTKDSDAFIACLQEKCVQMKSCSISDNTLIGEVCVFHSCPKNTVNMKMTFDSWVTSKEIPCKFLEQRQVNGLDVDVFFFEACLPQITDKIEQIEFCFTSSPGLSSVLHWDDNMGQNYKVLREKVESCPGKDYTKQFYPSLSNYQLPVYPQFSYFQKCENLTYLHSHLLTSGFRSAHCKPLCWLA
ncbi:protein phosphatase 1 regulatory subunit 3B [Poeciliopsis prolifica]|uniref:protein phosphatase 1 regulatory subunit 3B n=1 Tax=Poeciliopsis prolifica TaxID=188132 RepID=UPI0024139851|nr:protein phosphatase 1 regulatory subunit 3B [Poeciliopsis prolifica]XP_054896002.1 protein phosphatase 1 regulatory subunit 3B [Poeciliopsis prolifica]